MDDFLTVIGIVSAVASFIGLFLPAQGWKQRALHVIYGLVIAILASFAIRYQAKLSALTTMGNEAAALVATGYSTSAEAQGFILASLSFLEKHKGELPDTYDRAVLLAESCGAIGSTRGDYHTRMDLWDAADSMRSLLRGIASSKK